jgi:hypothetical protein
MDYITKHRTFSDGLSIEPPFKTFKQKGGQSCLNESLYWQFLAYFSDFPQPLLQLSNCPGQGKHSVTMQQEQQLRALALARTESISWELLGLTPGSLPFPGLRQFVSPTT